MRIVFSLLLVLVSYGEGKGRFVSRGDQGPDDENASAPSTRVSPGNEQD